MNLKEAFKKIEKLKYFAIVPANINSSIFEIDSFSIETFMGQSLGSLKWAVLFSLIFSVLSFLVATFFIIRYTREFYAKRTIPSSWQFILWGIFATAIAEIGDFLGFYEWPKVGFVETNFLLVIPHVIGGILIGYGSYLLYKEIKV